MLYVQNVTSFPQNQFDHFEKVQRWSNSALHVHEHLASVRRVSLITLACFCFKELSVL